MKVTIFNITVSLLGVAIDTDIVGCGSSGALFAVAPAENMLEIAASFAVFPSPSDMSDCSLRAHSFPGDC